MSTETQPGEPVTLDQLTDTGNADLLVDCHAATLRYCPDMGRWLQWDSFRWALLPDDAEAWQAAAESVRSIDPGDSERLAKHKQRSLAAPKLSAMVGIARRQPKMRVRVDRLDADPYALSTPSGVVDLRTGRLRAPEPEGWHTKVTGCGVATTPDGTAIDRDPYMPRFNRFLQDTFGEGEQGDEIIDYTQELAGLAAIGEVREHVLPFLFGGGANGKSVLLDVLTEVLGDYAITAPATFLLAGRAEKHETEIARLRGARLVVCSEINSGNRFDEAKMKALTGGDKLTGRFMHQNFFDFTPSHTLFLAGNHQPEVTAGGTSFWRRLRLIPFTNTVPDEKRVEGLAQQLVAEEGPAILAWIAAGAKRVLARGLRTAPQAVLDATGEYSDDTKTGVARFLDECCTVGGDDTVRAQAAHASYSEWAQHNNEPPLTIQKFGLDMRAAGVTGPPKDRNGRSYYLTVHTERLPASKAAWHGLNSSHNSSHLRLVGDELVTSSPPDNRR